MYCITRRETLGPSDERQALESTLGPVILLITCSHTARSIRYLTPKTFKLLPRLHSFHVAQREKPSQAIRKPISAAEDLGSGRQEADREIESWYWWPEITLLLHYLSHISSWFLLFPSCFLIRGQSSLRSFFSTSSRLHSATHFGCLSSFSLSFP